ncbi:methylenetetrahydrofolate reductase C-terminal domain-containing protein [Caballeronia sp. LP006]|uniref:methylenetetrahydrofolate reductase C-terminal domain-containing protein n=1 Tax=Caballeronia sp. LP006 TaxID=3038552 RepID=UPI0028631D81|nr:methylenetetrahydrofolate reductase C-terminal domain-containing protein [Caballeronia sp. LP006]MDR5832313.1 methylenetetrahydrofolate reductase C-terminal domain-containing protein [Caballeronia sp. LP006]
MKALRRWSLKHARGMRTLYGVFERTAPALAPIAKLIGPNRLEAVVLPIERAAKTALFDCQMCGQCGLSVTGMACPTGCAKGMRNGPCGGVRPDGQCEVRPERRCTWVDATEGDARIRAGHTESWSRRASPRDFRLNGKSTWMPMIATAIPATAGTPAPVRASVAAESSAADDPVANDFAALCRERSRFIVTVEISPPDSADPQALLKRADLFRGLTDAINITDGAGANCHMSSAAASALLISAGFTPVTQASCRDRNRIALQGDILGAAALGVRNVLCLTGDDVSKGDHAGAKPVFDLDSVNLLHTLRGMSERGEYASGRKLERAPRLFLGATANPFVPPYGERIANLERKVDAGAQFIQTQFCFDLNLLEQFMHEVRARGLHERTAIIVGVGVLSTARALRWMADHVPGVNVPMSVTERIAAAADQRLEGKQFCIDMIRSLRSVEGVAGVHLMGYKNEEVLAQIIEEAGLRAPVRGVESVT